MTKTPSGQARDSCDSNKLVRSLPQARDNTDAAALPRILSDSSEATDSFGEQNILPRIGNEYQAEITSSIGNFSHRCYLRHCTDGQARTYHLQNFLVGLPLPLVWIDGQKHETVEMFTDSKDVKALENYSGTTKPLDCSQKSLNGVFVPGLLGESWSDAEKASFLLGLYIFKKNFVEVGRFIETKNMGAILSYYYGKFYCSEEYKRWSDGCKKKSKKCVYGKRLFSGFRLQELLSRILPRVSEELRSSILAVSKAFGGEKISLAEYVSSLKAVVGMSELIKAFGIGTGKQDLTGMALEPPTRSTQAILVWPDVPAGKACSSLTTAEIVNYLNGDCRLSKARSSDIFWEAVWPRLLARGWHSEQPKDNGRAVVSTRCLVFLVPGIKKFARELVKGNQYYDSVSDVLSRVAREPELIELDETHGSEGKNEHDSTGEGQERRSYLQPRMPKMAVDNIKFTVVDTSLSGTELRELRTLPSEISDTNTYHPDCWKLPIPDSKKEDDMCNDELCRKPPKSKSRRKRTESGNPKPLSKRCQQSTANSHEETRDGSIPFSKANGSENGISGCCTGVHQSNLESSASSYKGSPGESIEHIPATQRQVVFDLNLPIESKNGARQKDNQSVEMISPIPLRHSTRIRPPTVRALEAVADGYLAASPRRRRRDRNEDIVPRPLQRARVSADPSESNNSLVTFPA